MLENNIQLLKQKLREQSNLAYSENTLAGIFYVMYGFVEIIENDPIFSKFIQAKVYEENEIHRSINRALREKEIDKKLWYQLAKLHISGKFWNEYYSLFKAAHDSIKLDRCHALGIKADNIAADNLFLFDASDPKFSKRLTKEEADFYTDDFEKCLEKITELINSDQKLLGKIFGETKIENSEEPNIALNDFAPKYVYNPYSELGLITFKDDAIKFKGRRAIILDYFFKTNPKLATYRDFSEWLKLKKIKNVKVSSVNFRQDIEKICKRIKNESNYIESVITRAKKRRKLLREINFYDFDVLYK